MICLNSGSNHPSALFKLKLPSVAVVYARDVAWAYPQEPITLPEPARGGGHSLISTLRNRHFSEAPHLRRSIPHSKTDFNKNI